MSTAFDKLARPIQKWIRQNGWRELRDIQAQSIRIICDSEADLIISAATAGGKTEAAFFPLISQVLDAENEEMGFDLLYIGPLKALITDQAQRLEGICQEAELPVYPWHGDVSQSVKNRADKKPNGILLITPESLESMFMRRGLEIPRLFGATRAVVIDELHTVLDSERGIQVRSLLTRLEIALKRPIRRIGLSATLGDMNLARAYLRPDNPENVELIEAKGNEAELKLELRGYYLQAVENDIPHSTRAIASHIFDKLRGSDNLVFAGSRKDVETYADQLRVITEKKKLPLEFYPHHANLSAGHRDMVERRLKNSNTPTTAVCTSTLELGIDIGDVASVAHIGAPFSVAALRQRLGRSGRREGMPAVLRQYVVEVDLEPDSNFVDRLRLGLIRSMAMIDLLVFDRWCEPPKPQALHLSTLVHQILSVIAQHGGASASMLYGILCERGPFRKVSKPIFMDVLRKLGDAETDLIEQSDAGLLFLGAKGEKIVEHYSFYAVFQTPEEFRIICEGQELGTIPINYVLAPKMMIIFSGHRWVVMEVHDYEKVIVVKPAEGGVPPKFGGDVGDIHDKVIERMFEILEGDSRPIYMDANSLNMLEEAREYYGLMNIKAKSIIPLDEGGHGSIIATRVGTIKTTTLALALRSFGFTINQHDGFLYADGNDNTPSLQVALGEIASGEEINLFEGAGNLNTEKFHPHLSHDLRAQDALSSKLAPDALADIASKLLEY